MASILLTPVNESFDPRSENLAQFTNRDIIQKFLQPIEQMMPTIFLCLNKTAIISVA
jgi:hypothetical protein